MNDGIDWDDAFANMKHIPHSATLPDHWASCAQGFRDAWEHKELDVVYGHHEREKLDFFFPESSAKGLMIFIHGGYWMRLDKSYWSHLSRGSLDRSLAVAMPSYTLTPESRISDITHQIACAITVAVDKVDGPIYLVGHSAGGHLVTRMNCVDEPLNSAIHKRIVRILTISGVHDLRPLLLTEMNETLNLSSDEAIDESPVLCTALTDVPVIAWVGAKERPEFLRQTQLLQFHWPSCTSYFGVGDDHFSVLDGLQKSDSALLSTLFEK